MMKKSVTFYLAIFAVIYLTLKLTLVAVGVYHEPYYVFLVVPVAIGAATLVQQFVKIEKRAPTLTERDKLVWPCLLLIILFYVSCGLIAELGLPDLSGFAAETGTQSRLGLVIVELLFGFFILIIRFDYTSRNLAKKLDANEV